MGFPGQLQQKKFGGGILVEILLRKKQFKRSTDLLAFVHKS
jgi:hypothetical protein